MRRVVGPDGVAWNVDVSWTDLRLGGNFTERRRRRANERRDRAVSPAHGRDGKDRGWWLGALEAFPDDTWSFVAVVAVIVVTVVAVFAFPWLLVLFLDFAELLAFPLLALIIVGWRVTRRRPFTITAERGGELVAEWRVVGLREARRVERAVADAVVAGGEPPELFPDYTLLH